MSFMRLRAAQQRHGRARGVIVRDWKEIVTVAGIIGLRAALTFLIHWEIKEEKNHS